MINNTENIETLIENSITDKINEFEQSVIKNDKLMIHMN